VVCACGVCVWCVRVVCACGVCVWCVRVVCACGVCVWCVHVVCACVLCFFLNTNCECFFFFWTNAPRARVQQKHINKTSSGPRSVPHTKNFETETPRSLKPCVEKYHVWSFCFAKYFVLFCLIVNLNEALSDRFWSCFAYQHEVWVLCWFLFWFIFVLWDNKRFWSDQIWFLLKQDKTNSDKTKLKQNKTKQDKTKLRFGFYWNKFKSISQWYKLCYSAIFDKSFGTNELLV